MAEKKHRAKTQIVWPPDAVIAAKWIAVFVAILYARWIIGTFWDVGGVFQIDKSLITGGDFVNYWTAARLTLASHVMTLFDQNSFHHAMENLFDHPITQYYSWGYPPHFLLGIFWLGLLPYPVALAMWLAGTFALYAFAVAYKRLQNWTLTLILLLSPAVYANFSVGQNGFLSGALLVGGLRLLAVNPVLAGIAFGCLSYKPQLGILIPFALLAARQWRAFASATSTTLILIGTSILLFGTEPWLAFIKTILPFQRTMLEMDPQVTFTRMYPTVFMSARIFGAPLIVAYAFAVIAALAAITIVIYAFRRRASAELQNAILLTAAFLASPYLLFYDMPALSAGIIGTAAAAGPHLKTQRLLLLIAAYILPLAVFPLGRAGIPLAPLVIAGMLWMQLLLMKEESSRRAAS